MSCQKRLASQSIDIGNKGLYTDLIIFCDSYMGNYNHSKHYKTGATNDISLLEESLIVSEPPKTSDSFHEGYPDNGDGGPSQFAHLPD